MATTDSTPQRIEAHATLVGGGLPIRRALPAKARKMVGAWCFLDHAGPALRSQGIDLRVGPHPHIGLQTFTWMIEGELLHRDSLGSLQVVRPGQVNLMTAGRGISHSEETTGTGDRLHATQLWIALPEAQRWMEPAFAHYPELPGTQRDGFALTLLAGCFGDLASPVQVHTPLLGIDLCSTGAAETMLPLEAAFEHGVLVLEGSVEAQGETLAPGTLLYLPPGATALKLRCTAATRSLLLGGAPFGEPILLWWNFVGRTQQDVEEATRDWNAGSARFGTVQGYEGPRLSAPDLAGLHLRGTGKG